MATVFALFSAPAPISAPQGHFCNTGVQAHPKFSVWDVNDPVKIKTCLDFVGFSNIEFHFVSSILIAYVYEILFKVLIHVYHCLNSIGRPLRK